MNRLLAVLLLAVLLPTGAASLLGQDSAAGVPDRLRNALRNIKQDPAAAAEEASKADPDAALQDAIRRFQAESDGIEADKLKAAAAKMQSDGLLDKAKETAEQLKKDGVLDEVAAKAEAAMRAVSAGAGAGPDQTESAPAAPAPPSEPAAEVPATRPPPGIAGGAPAPVAMPIEPGAPEPEPAEEAPAMLRATEALPSAVAVATGAATVVETVRVQPLAGVAPTTPSIPDTPVLDLDEVPAPMPLGRKYGPGAERSQSGGDRKHMEILAKESIMDNTKGVLLFTGNVFIDHPEFEIKCDKLEIQLAEGVGKESGGDSDTNFKRAIASGGMVEIRRIAVDEKGKTKTQIAISRIADYNAITKDIVLTGGPPYIQDGDKFVKTNSEDAKIIMRGNGLYEITGSTNRVQIVIPIEDDGKNKGTNVLPTGLETSINRRR